MDGVHSGQTACAHNTCTADDQCKHACRKVAAQDRLDLTWPWNTAPSLLHGLKHVCCCLLHDADLILRGLVGCGACICRCWLQQSYSAELPTFKAQPGLLQEVDHIQAAPWHKAMCVTQNFQSSSMPAASCAASIQHVCCMAPETFQGWTFSRCCVGNKLNPTPCTINPRR